MSEEQRKANDEELNKDEQTKRALSDKEIKDVAGGAQRRNADERGGRGRLRN